jgi:homoserine dehydrogenase
MKKSRIILMGFGNVGRAFVQLVREKREVCATKYGFLLSLVAVFNSKGGFLLPEGAAGKESLLDRDDDLDWERSPFWRGGRILEEAMESHPAGVFVECTPSNIKTGEPALNYIRQAIEKGWHVVTANKGPLVADLAGIMQRTEKKGVCLGMSGATAAALPTLDVALHSLAGADIRRIEGILNGTTNFILTRMKEGRDYKAALEEAQKKGIAERDPSQDVEGWDTAAKILIIANAVFRSGYTLDDVRVEGITRVPPKLWEEARKKKKTPKLLGRYSRDEENPIMESRLCLLEPSHPLAGVNGAQKGITFFTDTMDTITVIGGKSDPRGAAAALLKDIINIYRT